MKNQAIQEAFDRFMEKWDSQPTWVYALVMAVQILVFSVCVLVYR